MKESFQLLSTDGKTRLQGYLWTCDDPKWILQLSHGMAEHILRYAPLAEWMNLRGILVVGHDHLGHGKSARADHHGYFHSSSVEKGLVQDLYQVTKYVKGRYPELPIVVLGHSMGSFVLRNYLYTHSRAIDGAVIVGTGQQPNWLTRAGKTAASLIGSVKGDYHKSKLIDRLAFGGNNRKIKHPRTDKDWLVSLPHEVDAYLADQFCGFLFTVNGYQELFSYIIDSQDKEKIREIPSELPLLFLSGMEDPVGEYGKGVLKAAKSYRNAGIKQIEVRLYENARHEVLNERQKEQVFCDLFKWLGKIEAKEYSS
ncbi:alpha/beta fold hydrolase [Enterococcus florum]|nr:alpha/beta fold hydrolase [Enterococcus florum]